MSSGEDYLDSLLKAVLEGKNVSDVDKTDLNETSAEVSKTSGDVTKAMSNDEISEMLNELGIYTDKEDNNPENSDSLTVVEHMSDTQTDDETVPELEIDLSDAEMEASTLETLNDLEKMGLVDSESEESSIPNSDDAGIEDSKLESDLESELGLDLAALGLGEAGMTASNDLGELQDLGLDLGDMEADNSELEALGLFETEPGEIGITESDAAGLAELGIVESDVASLAESEDTGFDGLDAASLAESEDTGITDAEDLGIENSDLESELDLDLAALGLGEADMTASDDLGELQDMGLDLGDMEADNSELEALGLFETEPGEIGITESDVAGLAELGIVESDAASLAESEDTGFDGLDAASLAESEDTGITDAEDLGIENSDLESELDLDLAALGLGEADMTASDDLGELQDLGLDLGDTDNIGLDESLMGLLGGSDLSELGLDDNNADVLNGEFASDEMDSADIDQDLSSLLASMDSDDALSEIGDLLEKSDSGESVDDDMLALLEGGSSEGNSEGEEEPFNFFDGVETAESLATSAATDEVASGKKKKEKKKKEKKEKRGLFGKKKKDKADENNAENGKPEQDGIEDELGFGDAVAVDIMDLAALDNLLDAESTKNDFKKKKSFWVRFVEFLTEEDEEEESQPDDALMEFGDNGLPIGNPTEENMEILDELNAEDKKKEKKNKKDKKKKDKKGKQDKKAKNADEEGVEGEEEAEESSKKDKKKKKKKEKNPEEETPTVPEKKLSRKKVIPVFALSGTIVVCIVLLSNLIPGFTQKKLARFSFDQGDYANTYDLLYGQKLNEEDEAIFQKCSIILQMNRKIDSYHNYCKLGMKVEALNALITGVEKYEFLYLKAEEYGVVAPLQEEYEQIIGLLDQDFHLSEVQAKEIAAITDKQQYTDRLMEICDMADELGLESDAQNERKDVLPEEEEIIDRLEK